MKCAWKNMCGNTYMCCSTCTKKNCEFRCCDDPKTCKYLEMEDRDMPKVNNKKIGSDFEKRYCEYLSNNGYWVHFMNPSANGSQPFDILACVGNKDGTSLVIAVDCKTVVANRFSLDRIEDNQMMAFKKMNECGISNTYFALEPKKNHVVNIPSQILIELKENGTKSIDVREYDELYGFNIQ